MTRTEDDLDPMDEAPAQVREDDTGPRVRIMDLSGGAEDNIVEEIGRFQNVAHANAFARAYVRDSIEICRAARSTPRDTLEAWFAFGENAEVLNAGEDGWKASTEINDFVERPATPMERDWRALDPRRLVDTEELIFSEDDERPEPDSDEED